MISGSRTLAALVLAATACVALPARAQPTQGTVEAIETQGLQRMTREALLHVFGIHVGEPYDPAKIREEFRKMWNLGIFSDISVEAEDGPNGGKVLILKVKEKVVLTSVAYEDNKVLTRTQIEDRLKERKILLDPGKPLNLKSVFEAESAIRDYLGEKGYLDPQVSHRIDNPTETTGTVNFSIRPGGKTRIRGIHFVGNTVYSERRLLKSLKLTRAWRWWWPWSSKALYHPAKWDMDVANVRELYENRGYLDVDIRPPVVDVKQIVKGGSGKPADAAKDKAAAATPEAPGGGKDAAAASPKAAEALRPLSPREERKRAEKRRREEERAKKRAEKARKKAEPKVKRWVYLTVPVSEGPEYRAGNISVTGNSLFADKDLLAFIPLRKGDVVNIGLLKIAVDAITKAYGNKGYYLATAVQQRERHPETKIADVQIVINEDKPYYVSRIEFTGNTVTRDRVLRREFPLNEGDLFNRSLLDLGVSKLNQLGYFEAKEQPVVEPIEGESRVRITVEGEEKSRNEIQIGGGYSGLDGVFFQGLFSTRNFLGRGQTVSTSIQVGGTASRYSISFVEPWLFSRPYNLGFSLYRQDVDYGNSLTSSSRGGGAVVGRQLGYFTRIQTSFNVEVDTSTNFSVLAGQSTTRITSLTPSYSYYRVNNPYRPSRGWSITADVQLAGGALGGDTSFYKPMLLFSGYKRAVRRTFLGFHAEAGLIRSWQGASLGGTVDVNGVPRFSRFWIGGDTQGPRIFDVRTITPLRFVRLDSLGRIVEAVQDPRGRLVSQFDRNADGILDRNDLVEVGGDRYFLLQTEYAMPLSGPVEAAFFVDVGNSLFEDTRWGFKDARVSAGIEMRFYLPVFPVPLRLMYGWPLRKLQEDRTSNFMFSIGRSF
ncbi:MAG: outer membrane protein assembly factor BamA [Acidobacteriia bacterium]|nr:outer membrane protein assembly factor BamA [Terriglobia bacterium]